MNRNLFHREGRKPRPAPKRAQRERQPLNRFQKRLCEIYGDGDFFHLRDGSYQEAREYAQSGDTLFLFLLVELSDSEGCVDLDTACQRMETVVREVGDVCHAIDDMPDSEAA